MMSMKPSLCCVCERMSYLRCIDCDVVYCSGACKLKDWANHDEMKAANEVGMSEEEQNLMMEELERELRIVNEYLQKDEKKALETPIKKKKESTAGGQEEFCFFYESPIRKDDVVEEAPVKSKPEIDPKIAAVDTTAATDKNTKQSSIEVQKKIQKIIDADDKSCGFFGKLLNGVPGSITHKLMEPNFPEHVKKGLKVSVQGRLSAAKEKLSISSGFSSSSSSSPYVEIPCKNMRS